jgi:hypothetical protein
VEYIKCAANSATGFYTDAGSGYTGYALSNAFSLNAGQKQVWEYMLDCVHHFWDDTANAEEAVMITGVLTVWR